MAKNNQTPPSKGKVTEPVTVDTPSSTDPPKEAPKPTETAATPTVTITAPLAAEVTGHTRRGVSVKGLTTKQREGLQRLRNGLIRDKAELANGVPVMNDGAAVRWLLEQVG